MKAMDDGYQRRKKQFTQLATWLKEYELGVDVIVCGDTNVYRREVSDNPLIDMG